MEVKKTLDLIDSALYLAVIKTLMNKARREARSKKSNDLTQSQKNGEYIAYRKALKHFEELKQNI